MKKDLVGKVRELQLLATIFIFILATLLCWNITDSEITKIQISAWGAASETRWLWNSSIIVTSIGILFNVVYWIYHHNRLKYKWIFYTLFTVLSICLFIVGLFPTDKYKLIHDVSAYIYFFAYPLTIFLMGAMNRANITYNEWLKHLILSITMIILPLLFIKVFDGMAISEILHTFIVTIWNLTLLKNYETTKKDRIEA